MRGGSFLDDVISKLKPSSPEENCEKARKEVEAACPANNNNDLGVEPGVEPTIIPETPIDESSTSMSSPDEMGLGQLEQQPGGMGLEQPGQQPGGMGLEQPGQQPYEMGLEQPGQQPYEMGLEQPGQQPDEMGLEQQQPSSLPQQNVGFGGGKKSRRRNKNKKQSRRKKTKSSRRHKK
jgi:hypothetical protein